MISHSNKTIDADLLADIVSVSKSTLSQWEKKGKITPTFDNNGRKIYHLDQLIDFHQIKEMVMSNWENEEQTKPIRPYKSIELFAGAGGLAIGLEKAGFEVIALNELDKNACNTLRKNRPNWNIIEGDVRQIDFTQFKNVDFLFFEFARAVKECQPKVFLGENVRGLLEHDGGKTIATIKSAIFDLGYTLIEPKVLKAIFYKVPQKRERIMLIGIRNDLVKYANFKWPSPYNRICVLKDALKAGELYATEVPPSVGQKYPKRKEEILDYVPQGGYWRDLPDHLQREYMQGSYFLGGGKTGMARRLSWDAPSLTLTCSPSQKQTERCHPEESRPLTVREYARIQTFPDDWIFSGSMSSQYKQIGNAVPVNLALAVGRSLIGLLNNMETST